MTFWIVTSLMALAVAALFTLALLRARAGAAGPAAAYDLQVYRDQLKDVDRDLARGVIGAADAERIRAEVSRRILAADAQARRAEAGGGPSRPLTLALSAVIGLAVLAGSLLLYRSLGAPGYGDLSLKHRIDMAELAHANRPDQAAAEARLPASPAPEIAENYKALLEQLRSTVAQRPDDLRGHELLAQHEANTGNFNAAYAAKTRVIELKGADASAQDYADQGELMIMAAGGYVSPEAEAALRQALERDPGHGPARYYWGLMQAQTGRPDLAFRTWEATLRQGPEDGYWLAPIRAQIEDMAMRAGVDYQLPRQAPALAGPSAADVAAAGDMADADRQQMIRGMVDRLSERLATEGGSPAEWARLIGALGVLGETERARAIYDEARQVFAGNAAALTAVQDAAAKAGIAP